MSKGLSRQSQKHDFMLILILSFTAIGTIVFSAGMGNVAKWLSSAAFVVPTA